MADLLSMASEVTCSVCLEIYTDPLMLNCMHSYCKKCLKDIKNKTASERQHHLRGAAGGTGTIHCPNCRRPTGLGKDGIDGLPSNFTLASISDKLKSSLAADEKPVVLCSLCESDPKPAVKTCEDCSGTHYCRDCFRMFHPMRGAFKKHILTDIVTEKKMQQTKDKLPMYCHTCKTPFASSPSNIPEQHRQHNVNTLDRAVETEKAYVKTVLKDLKDRNEKQKENNAKAQAEYHERKEKLRGVSQVLQNASRRVEDSLEHVEVNFRNYQENSREIIGKLDEMLQKASLGSISGQQENEKVSFLKVAGLIRSQITKFQDSGATKMFSLSNIDVFLRNLSGYVSQELGVYQTSQSQDDSEHLVTGKAIRITEIKNLPSFFDIAAVRMTWSSSQENVRYSVRCVLSFATEGHSVREEINVDVAPGFSSLLIGGLRHKTFYTAHLTAKLGKQETVFEQTFETAEKISCDLFWWDTEECSPDIAFSGDLSVVTHKTHRRAMLKGNCKENMGNWIRVKGSCSSIFFGGGSTYWETLFRYKVLRPLGGRDVILNIGLCEEMKIDNFSPLSGNHHCLCLKLYKIPKQATLGIELWDGSRRSSKRITETCDIEMRKENLLHLGFFLDFNNCTFKIILVEMNVAIHTFSNIRRVHYEATCEFLNEDKVQSSVQLQTTGFTGLPSVLFD